MMPSPLFREHTENDDDFITTYNPIYDIDLQSISKILSYRLINTRIREMNFIMIISLKVESPNSGDDIVSKLSR